jgi:hypothetical protein
MLNRRSSDEQSGILRTKLRFANGKSYKTDTYRKRESIENDSISPRWREHNNSQHVRRL